MTQYFIGVFLICVGFLVRRYPDLIAGYNSLPEREKKEIDVNKLSRRIQITFIAIGVVILVTDYALKQMDLNHHVTIANISIILVGAGSLFVNNNYKKQK